MDPSKELEEKLRQASSLGDEQAVRILLATGINVNAQHPVNGWTALHWASKRGHGNIISLLLKHGADKRSVSKKGETPISVCSSPKSRLLLGGDGSTPPVTENTLPIIPHYLSHPPLSSAETTINVADNPLTRKPNLPSSESQNPKSPCFSGQTEEMVLKVRVANISDPDFIEVDISSPSDLTYSKLLRTCCDELGVIISDVVRVRKLPNTIVRNDKDVFRLKSFQELELVVTGLSKTVSSPVVNQSRHSIEESINNLRPNGVLPFNPPGSAVGNNNYQVMGLLKNQTILY